MYFITLKCAGEDFVFLKIRAHNTHCEHRVGSLLCQGGFFDVVLVLND